MRVKEACRTGLLAVGLILVAGVGSAGAAAQLSTIVFTPASPRLANPASAESTSRPSQVTLRLKAYDGFGNLIIPSAAQPIAVNVYGAPAGVITPVTTSITSGNTVTLSYNGGFFPNPITVEAYTANGIGGQAIGVKQMLQKNQPACVYGTQSFVMPFDCGQEADPACANDNITNGLNLSAVGCNNAVVGNLKDFTVDTG